MKLLEGSRVIGQAAAAQRLQFDCRRKVEWHNGAGCFSEGDDTEHGEVVGHGVLHDLPAQVSDPSVQIGHVSVHGAGNIAHDVEGHYYLALGRTIGHCSPSESGV